MLSARLAQIDERDEILEVIRCRQVASIYKGAQAKEELPAHRNDCVETRASHERGDFDSLPKYQKNDLQGLS